MLSPECQSAQMSTITNDGLTWSGTGCYSCTHMTTLGVKGLAELHGYDLIVNVSAVMFAVSVKCPLLSSWLNSSTCSYFLGNVATLN